jgi:hypothetical protein
MFHMQTLQSRDCQKLDWPDHKGDCRVFYDATKEAMEGKYEIHPIYKWEVPRIYLAMIKFRKAFLFELQSIVWSEYALSHLVSDTGHINQSDWDAKTDKDFPMFTLAFRKEPIQGHDYRQFTITNLVRTNMGLGVFPGLMKLEEEKHKLGTAVIIGVNVVNEKGESLCPYNMEVIWTEAITLMAHKSLNLTRRQVIARANEAVEAGKGVFGK